MPIALTKIGQQSAILKGFAADTAEQCLEIIHIIQQQSPFRQLTTPYGHTMSVMTTNCGTFGWYSDQSGYRYTPIDPITQQPWPEMPTFLADLANQAANALNFQDFIPDACLINRYSIQAKMGLHQDKDETDLTAPIVSLSFGLPIQFKWGGLKRSDTCETYLLEHGDVLVFGGRDRLRYHGVLTLKKGTHPLTHNERFNMTLRKAG